MKKPAHLIRLHSHYDDDGHFNCLSTCCHQRIPQADSSYKFCPYCGTALSGHVDDSARPSWVPRWNSRALALGLTQDTIDSLYRSGHWSTEYLWTHEYFSEINNRWERGDAQDSYPTSDRRQALRGFRRSIRHAWAGNRFRMVYFSRDSDRSETILAYALEITLTENTILSERNSFLSSSPS